MIDQIPETDKAYVAGFVDGEGTITITRQSAKTFGGNENFYTSLEISNTNLEILEWIQSLYGGTLKTSQNHKHGNRKISYVLYWYSEKARPVLVSIYPYLRIKKEHATLSLEFMNLLKRQGAGKGRKVSLDDVSERDDYCQEIQYLNKRGV